MPGENDCSICEATSYSYVNSIFYLKRFGKRKSFEKRINDQEYLFDFFRNSSFRFLF
jgi:hypothetical protein